MYKIIKTQNGEGVFKANENGSAISFPFDPANTDYQAYLKWLEEGNAPLGADTPEPAYDSSNTI